MDPTTQQIYTEPFVYDEGPESGASFEHIESGKATDPLWDLSFQPGSITDVQGSEDLYGHTRSVGICVSLSDS